MLVKSETGAIFTNWHQDNWKQSGELSLKLFDLFIYLLIYLFTSLLKSLFCATIIGLYFQAKP